MFHDFAVFTDQEHMARRAFHCNAVSVLEFNFAFNIPSIPEIMGLDLAASLAIESGL